MGKFIRWITGKDERTSSSAKKHKRGEKAPDEVDGSMTAEEIREAGLPISVPYESAVADPKPLIYQRDLVDGKIPEHLLDPPAPASDEDDQRSKFDSWPAEDREAALEALPCERCGSSAAPVRRKPERESREWWDDPSAYIACAACDAFLAFFPLRPYKKASEYTDEERTELRRRFEEKARRFEAEGKPDAARILRASLRKGDELDDTRGESHGEAPDTPASE